MRNYQQCHKIIIRILSQEIQHDAALHFSTLAQTLQVRTYRDMSNHENVLQRELLRTTTENENKRMEKKRKILKRKSLENI